MGRCEPPMDYIGQIDSDKVFYTGENLPNINVIKNQTLTQVLQILNQNSQPGTSLNIKAGTLSQVSDGITLVYNIPHTLGAIPSAVTVQALNNNSQGFTLTYNITNIIINYTIAPSLGDNINLSWIAIKL